MSANSFGHKFKMTSFGESHGEAYGVVIDGCPAGLKLNMNLLLGNLAKRKPGQGSHVTSRQEKDQPQILSGIFEGKTLGTPIAVIVKNTDQKSSDYDQIKMEPRIGHADDTWKNKFGHSDHRGGGRSSGRETLTRVIAGSFAQMLVNQLHPEVKIETYADQIGPFKLSRNKTLSDDDMNNGVNDLPQEVKNFLLQAKNEGQSYGGTVECLISNAPADLGQPIFHKFKSDLATAMMSIGATTGFQIGAGFSATGIPGTEFHLDHSSLNYGGIRGGITTGEDIIFKVAFKPTSSIKDVSKKGRHDPCIVPRAIPVVEAMAWLVLADHILLKRTDRA